MADRVHAQEDFSSGGDDLRAVFDDLVRVETRLYNALNERLRRTCGIVASQYEFLSAVGRRPDARVGDLATTFAVGVGAVSKAVDRLADRGWVVRERHPADGRSSLLRLTEEGSALVVRATAEVDDLLGELIGGSDPATSLLAAAGPLASVRSRLETAGIGRPVG